MAGISDKESPFTPGKPVPIEYFVARFAEVERLQRAIIQTSSGKNENVFITGERGIGKSSLASIMRHIAEIKHDFIGAHCHLGGVKSLEGMIRIIFQKLLQETSTKSVSNKLKTLFQDYIKGINLFGIVEFSTNQKELQTLLENFLPVIRNIYNKIKDDKKGIVLILDDLNGITGIPEFANFLKSFVDEIATSHEPIPLLLMLVGIQERRNELINHQPSVARIFDIINLTTMSKPECKKFFTTTFGEKEIEIEDDALSPMVKLSGGFPVLMHEIGDAIFWEDKDNYIDSEEAFKGIIEAATKVGRKYLDPQIYGALQSESYLSILRKIGALSFGESFKRKDIIKKFTDVERKNFDNFIRRIKRLGLITGTGIPGEYRFINQLYHIYVNFEAYIQEKENK